MKQRNSIIAILVLVLIGTAVAASLTTGIDAYKRRYKLDTLGEPPRAVVSRVIQESPASTGTLQVFDDDTNTVRDMTWADLPGQPFVVSGTLTSAAAATAVNLIADSAVPAGRKVYITGYLAKVDGATDWATTTSVTIEGTDGTDFSVLTASALDGNELHGPFSDSAAVAAAMSKGTGGTAATGVQVIGNANGTGSDLVVTIFGVIK